MKVKTLIKKLEKMEAESEIIVIPTGIVIYDVRLTGVKSLKNFKDKYSVLEVSVKKV